MPKLTKRLIDATQPGAKKKIIWDTEVKGFGLRVLPTGAMAYIYRYSVDGRKYELTICQRHEKPVDEAREAAKDEESKVRHGGNPLAARKAKVGIMTVAALADLYMESASFKTKARSTQGTDRGRIERHIKPLLGKMPVATLRPEHIRRTFAAVRDGATAGTTRTGPRGLARVTGGPGTAGKSVLLLRAMFRWAKADGHMAEDPTAGIKVAASGVRETILEDAAQYERLFRVLDRMEAEHRIRGPAADAIRLIALTAARRGEVAGLRWRHVEMAKGRVVIPPGEHKTGGKTGKERIIALPAEAQAIIARQSEGAPDDLVFRPATGTNPLSLSKPWRAVRAEAGLPEGIGLHGLRHSLASSMAMAGASAVELMTALGHRQVSTTTRYVHFADSTRAALAERSAAHITAALRGTEQGEVIPLPARKK